jgi:precorrin-4/cobalt-precorrin-4 C11-methyltransferase
VGHVLGTEEFRDSYLYDESKAHVYRPKVKGNKARSVDTALAHPTGKS